jgi:hypothetical protein
MGWIKRKADEHTCQKPNVQASDVASGDIWECDHCGTQWRVHDDQRDGKYFLAIPGTGLAPT